MFFELVKNFKILARSSCVWSWSLQPLNCKINQKLFYHMIIEEKIVHYWQQRKIRRQTPREIGVRSFSAWRHSKTTTGFCTNFAAFFNRIEKNPMKTFQIAWTSTLKFLLYVPVLALRTLEYFVDIVSYASQSGSCCHENHNLL